MTNTPKKKILFLDIDGVLAGDDYLCNRANGGDFIDPEKVKLLNSLHCMVVISSSWGDDNGRTEKTLKEKGLMLPIVGYTVHYEIGHDWIVRGNSIAKWLDDNCRNLNEEYQYAIVDDDDDMLMRQAGHFVQTDSYTGITESDIEKLRNILESDII
jgi:hypothetical protein